MDIAIVGKNSIKIKGKQASFILDPSKELPKTSADAIMLSNGYDNIDISRVTDSRIIISGAGGYEVGGAKISGTTTSKGTLYRISIDGVVIIVGKVVETKADGFNACQVAIVNTEDVDFNESFITSLEPKITVLYGPSKIEWAKTLGSQSVTEISKITVAKDKLPEKMEVVVLG